MAIVLGALPTNFLLSQTALPYTSPGSPALTFVQLLAISFIAPPSCFPLVSWSRQKQLGALPSVSPFEEALALGRAGLGLDLALSHWVPEPLSLRVLVHKALPQDLSLGLQARCIQTTPGT